MDVPISASFRWNKEEFLRSQRLAVRCSRYGPFIYRFFAIMGTIISAIGVVGFCKHQTGWLGFLYTMAFGAFFFSVPLWSRRAVLKLYMQKPECDMQETWEITDAVMRFKTGRVSADFQWEFFKKVRKVKYGFLVYPNDRQCYWLPMHAFREADAERFAELAKAKVRDYAEVS